MMMFELYNHCRQKKFFFLASNYIGFKFQNFSYDSYSFVDRCFLCVAFEQNNNKVVVDFESKIKRNTGEFLLFNFLIVLLNFTTTTDVFLSNKEVKG